MLRIRTLLLCKRAWNSNPERESVNESRACEGAAKIGAPWEAKRKRALDGKKARPFPEEPVVCFKPPGLLAAMLFMAHTKREWGWPQVGGPFQFELAGWYYDLRLGNVQSGSGLCMVSRTRLFSLVAVTWLCPLPLRRFFQAIVEEHASCPLLIEKALYKSPPTPPDLDRQLSGRS